MSVEGLVYHSCNRVGRGEAPFKFEEEAGRFWLLPLLAYLAPLLMPVEWVHRSRVNFDQDLVVRGDRPFDRLAAQHVGRAVRAIHDRLHGGEANTALTRRSTRTSSLARAWSRA